MAAKHILSSQGPGLYEFLIEAELQHYYNALKADLKVQTVGQLKYVTDTDLSQIGMSRPEMRRLFKYFHRHCPQTYLGKMKKKLLYRRDDGITVASLTSSSHSSAGHSSRVGHVAPGRHIIQADSIVIHKTLGSGEFGTVQQGVWTSDDGERIQVAIKCLTQERMENNPVEFLKEAAIMHTVDHEHIVRLYGVVLDTSSLMLVTELAPLRSLLEFIKEPSMRANLTVPTLFDFSVQICSGMQYLESKRLIHRDLAARNILVFSKKLVKISDFGLSRALGVGKDYYQTNFNVNLKLPIAWCAPESINFLRFTSASDVWAYGVTIWEIFSYGFQPWAALTGQQILEAIDEPNYQRLEKPECCPNELYYQLMLKCWQHNPSDRPNFSQIACILPECKPEQVQAIRDFEPKSRRDFLEYKTGDILVVLEKNPTGLNAATDDAVLWKGVLKCGKTGLFHPMNTITYIGSSLPCLSNKIQGSFKRNDSRSSSLRKSRLSTDMISSPQGDLQHTGHVGCDGEIFGDLTFLGSKCWPPKQQVVRPYRPDSASSDTNDSISSRLHIQRNRVAGEAEIPSNDTAPLIRQGSDSGSQKKRPNALSLLSSNGPDHEYHEISDEENELVGGAVSLRKEATGGFVNPALSSTQSPLNSPAFEKHFDLGPSLVDEVFEALHEDLQSDEANNVKNDLKEMATQRKKFATVKPISSSDRRTLDQAIAIANELASRSMLDLDRSGRSSHRNNSLDDISSPKTPSSPSYRKKFSFILGSSKNDREKRNYSQEAASIADIQSTLSEESKEAYNSLIEKTGSLGLLTPSSLENKSATFQFPEKSSSSSSKKFDVLDTGRSLINKERDSQIALTNTSHMSTGNIVIPSPIETKPHEAEKEAADVSESEDEEQNPLRMLRMNRSGNILPLPPRDRQRPILADRLSIRHQRKHQLLIPEEKQSQRSDFSFIKPPIPPPKPHRQQRHVIMDNSAYEFHMPLTKELCTPREFKASDPEDGSTQPMPFAKNSKPETIVPLYENYEDEDISRAINEESSTAQESTERISVRENSPSLSNIDTTGHRSSEYDKSSQSDRDSSAMGMLRVRDTLEKSSKGNELCSPTKIKIVQRILGSMTTEEDARWALEMTGGDRAKAVKLLRLKSLLPDSVLADNASNVVSVLADVHWDVVRASEFLLDTANKNPNYRRISKPLENGNLKECFPEPSLSNHQSTTDVPEPRSATLMGGSYIRPSHV